MMRLKNIQDLILANMNEERFAMMYASNCIFMQIKQWAKEN